LKVKLRIRNTTYIRLEERLIGDITTMKPENDDWRRITVSVGNDEGFRRLIRMLGKDVEVLAPPELRKEFAELAQTLADRYLSDATA
jgi:predicted DNA-binding transcriptional regulator YafY